MKLILGTMSCKKGFCLDIKGNGPSTKSGKKYAFS